MDSAPQDPRLKAALQATTESSIAAAVEAATTANGTESGQNGVEAAATPGSQIEAVAGANGTAAPDPSAAAANGATGLFAPSSPSETATAQVAESYDAEGAAAEAVDVEATSNGTAEDAVAVMAVPESNDESAAINTKATASSEAATVAEGTAPPSTAAPAVTSPKAEPASSLSPPPPVFTERAPVPPTRKPPQTRLALLKQSVEKDPWDGEAWLELIADAEKKGDLERTREVYKTFLDHFPDAAPQWIGYANLELEHGNFEEVEKIFSQCLRKSVSVDLWVFYLNYVRRISPLEGDKAAQSRTMISSAYEFSLDHIGMDPYSGPVWLDYINIVKSGDVAGTWQEQQKMDTLRKLYQRAVCVPLTNVEQIWREYDQFENSNNKMTAKKFLAERSSQYMTARSAVREMKILVDGLWKPLVPTRPTWTSPADLQHVQRWKAYLAWEERNPLDLDDQPTLQGRIQYAYKQALMHMRFFPELWYLAATNLNKAGKTDDSLVLLRSGLTANPSSMVLTYAVAEQEESKGNVAECHKVYESLIAHFHDEITSAQTSFAQELETAMDGRPPVAKPDEVEGMDTELSEEEQKRAQEEEKVRNNVKKTWEPKIEALKKALANVYIAEMQFACRAESIAAARQVFAKVRTSPHRSSQVFAASAMMEYHKNDSAEVAKKIFKLGFNQFGEDVEYILVYLDFLISLNDETNARAALEKAVSQLSPEAARPLWDRWASYEYQFGDSTAIQKLDARMAKLYPESSSTDRLVQRHTTFGHNDALDKELGRSFVAPSPSEVSAARPDGGRSASPVPPHLQGFKSVGGDSRGPGPAGPSNLPPAVGIPPRPKNRDRSFSPDGRGKRPRNYRDRSPLPPPRGPPRYGEPDRGRRRYDSPPPPPREDPYAWFPEGVRFFMGVLPYANSFDGPRLDVPTVMQVLADADLSNAHPVNGGPGGGRGPPPMGPPGGGGGWGRPPPGRPLSPPRGGRRR